MAAIIHQEISFKTTSERLYQALTVSENFAQFSDTPAEIDAVVGGKFSCFGGMITGVMIELIPDRLLVQAWRAGNWDAGVYSIAKFEFEVISDTVTKLMFDHTGYPEQDSEHLEQGWYNKYWTPLEKHLNT